jgi:hypothetical protein
MSKKIFSFLLITALSLSLFLFLACRQDVLSSDIIEVEREVEPVGSIDLSSIEVVSKDLPVHAGEMVWEIISAQDLGTSIVSSEYIFESTVGKIIQLDFTILNNSEESQILYDLHLIDNKGRVFSICLPAYSSFSAEKACALQEIIPGLEYDFIAPFDIATDSEGLILEVTDLKTPAEEKVYIDLGI